MGLEGVWLGDYDLEGNTSLGVVPRHARVSCRTKSAQDQGVGLKWLPSRRQPPLRAVWVGNPSTICLRQSRHGQLT